MKASHYEAERTVHSRGKGRRAPFLLAGALICYALTGVMALAMLVESRGASPMWVCGIAEIPTTSITCPLC